MFGNKYFAGNYFAPTYFGPVVMSGGFPIIKSDTSVKNSDTVKENDFIIKNDTNLVSGYGILELEDAQANFIKEREFAKQELNTVILPGQVPEDISLILAIIEATS